MKLKNEFLKVRNVMANIFKKNSNCQKLHHLGGKWKGKYIKNREERQK